MAYHWLTSWASAEARKPRTAGRRTFHLDIGICTNKRVMDIRKINRNFLVPKNQ